jgi:hypothetical protein
MVNTLSDPMEGLLMTIRVRRIVSAGALAVAAVAAPLAIAMTNGAGQAVAGPACLAWYGSIGDGTCLSYSNGSPTTVGTPFGVFGPNGGTGVGGYNGGVVAGPLGPNQTWTAPIG